VWSGGSFGTFRVLSTMFHLRRSSIHELIVYTDIDWVRRPDTHRSTSSYVVLCGAILISWSSMRQPMVSYSSAKAEYQTVANGASCASFSRSFATPSPWSTLIYCKVSASSTSPSTPSSISTRSMSSRPSSVSVLSRTLVSITSL
jgi:hypothetical protein